MRMATISRMITSLLKAETIMGSTEMQPINNLQSAARGACAIGDYSHAEGIYRRVLWLIGKKFGACSFEYAQCLEEIAEIYELKEEWAVAEQLHTEAAAVYGKLEGSSQAAIALVLRNLAEVCRKQGKNTDAKQFEMEAASILSLRIKCSKRNTGKTTREG